MPQLEPKFLHAPSQSTDARVNFVWQRATAEAHSQVRPVAAASPSQVQRYKADEAAAPTVCTMMKLQNESEQIGSALAVKNESPDTKPLVALVPKAQQKVMLPLIRSKTGRIILPSSLKPGELGADGVYTALCFVVFILIRFSVFFLPKVGQGYYTITFLSPQQKEQGGEDQPHHEESLKKEGDSLSISDSPANGFEDSHTPFPGTTSKRPSEAENAENCPAKVLKKNPAPPTGEKPRRGRPPKCRPEPVPGKRARGRPRKPTAEVFTDDTEDSSDDGTAWRPPVDSRSNQKRKCTQAKSARLSDRSSRRPLTRGALGKDFPSAKKRSWIDVERELEVDTMQ